MGEFYPWDVGWECGTNSAAVYYECCVLASLDDLARRKARVDDMMDGWMDAIARDVRVSAP